MKTPLILSTLLAAPSLQAANIITWNTAFNTILAPVNYDGTGSGPSRGVSTDVTANAATLTGITSNNSGDFDIIVPTTALLTHYMELTIIAASGLSFDAGQIRVAVPYGAVGGDLNAGFQVRSSLDNFGSLISTSAVDPTSGRNTTPGGTVINYDLVADISSMPDVVDDITYRLYFYDPDGLVKIRGSITTMPEGIRIVGPSATLIPEPSAVAMTGLAGLAFAFRRRRSYSAGIN
jgi:hypothetical protein